MRFEFDTGRPYSPAGQWITVEYDEATGVALFADATRGVDGEAALQPGLARWQVEGAVLRAYDVGDYEGTLRSRGFAEAVHAEGIDAAAAGEPPDPAGACPHEWVYTGTRYGGDDERWGGEGRCYCALCGADGDA